MLLLSSQTPLLPFPFPKLHLRHNNPRIQSRLNHVSLPHPSREDKKDAADEVEEERLIPSAAAVAAAIRSASPTSPVEFNQRVVKHGASGVVLPSADFRKLCADQLDLFRMVVHRDAVLSVYVRPAGSYVMDQLELRQITFFPEIDTSDSADCVILVGNFAMPAGLRTAEAALSKQQVEFVPECGAVVLPMVKHPFVVGFLVAELPEMEMETRENNHNNGQCLPFSSFKEGSHSMRKFQAFEDGLHSSYGQFTTKQRCRAIMISRSLAMAHVMDQKTMLLQQSSWQNNVRMSHLIEQIHGSLSSIRALSKMLSVQVKRSEISYDITEDILIQGENMKDTLQQLQDAVYLTKANVMQYNEDTLKKMHDPIHDHEESSRSLLSDSHSGEPKSCTAQKMDSFPPLGSGIKDIEMPMPPLLLAPLQQHNIRPSSVSDILRDLVGAALPLANKQQRFLKLRELSHPLSVVVEESALLQALSNLIEGALLRTQVGGTVEICAAAAPAGGALIVIDDNGPDMHYMTQMHSLTPFGADLFLDGRVQDNMTWNFVAGLAVAREILENYGCVIRVISPCNADAAMGAGGTRIEISLPSAESDLVEPGLDA